MFSTLVSSSVTVDRLSYDSAYDFNRSVNERLSKEFEHLFVDDKGNKVDNYEGGGIMFFFKKDGQWQVVMNIRKKKDADFLKDPTVEAEYCGGWQALSDWKACVVTADREQREEYGHPIMEGTLEGRLFPLFVHQPISKMMICCFGVILNDKEVSNLGKAAEVVSSWPDDHVVEMGKFSGGPFQNTSMKHFAVNGQFALNKVAEEDFGVRKAIEGICSVPYSAFKSYLTALQNQVSLDEYHFAQQYLDIFATIAPGNTQVDRAQETLLNLPLISGSFWSHSTGQEATAVLRGVVEEIKGLSEFQPDNFCPRFPGDKRIVPDLFKLALRGNNPMNSAKKLRTEKIGQLPMTPLADFSLPVIGEVDHRLPSVKGMTFIQERSLKKGEPQPFGIRGFNGIIMLQMADKIATALAAHDCGLNKIFNDQHMPVDAQKMTFAMLGRLLYDAGEMEDWKVKTNK